MCNVSSTCVAIYLRRHHRSEEHTQRAGGNRPSLAVPVVPFHEGKRDSGVSHHLGGLIWKNDPALGWPASEEMRVENWAVERRLVD